MRKQWFSQWEAVLADVHAHCWRPISPFCSWQSALSDLRLLTMRSRRYSSSSSWKCAKILNEAYRSEAQSLRSGPLDERDHQSSLCLALVETISFPRENLDYFDWYEIKPGCWIRFVDYSQRSSDLEHGVHVTCLRILWKGHSVGNWQKRRSHQPVELWKVSRPFCIFCCHGLDFFTVCRFLIPPTLERWMLVRTAKNREQTCVGGRTLDFRNILVLIET